MFYVQTSNNYSPGLPQNPGSANAGNWDSIPLNPVPTTSSANSYTAVVTQTGPAWARFVVDTVSSGSFLLSATFSAKSLGV